MIDLTDKLTRPPISQPIKDSIRDLFAVVPEGKNNAFIAIYDFEKKDTRLHFAYKINETWKVGTQIGWTVNKKPTGYVGIEAIW